MTNPPPPSEGELPPTESGPEGEAPSPGGYALPSQGGPAQGGFPSAGGYPPPPQGAYSPPPPQGAYSPPPSQGAYSPPPSGGYSSPGSYPPPPPQSGYPQQGGYPPPPQGAYPPPPSGGYSSPGSYPPPPPQSGYPQQGGYPPPPQGAYQGGYPPPPQQGSYPPPQGGYSQQGSPGFGSRPEVNIGEGFSWAWNKFSKNIAALVVPTLVYALVVGAIYGIITLISGALASDSTSSYDSYDSGFSYSFVAGGFGAASIIAMLIGYLVLFVAGGAIASAYYGGLLDIANGQAVTIGSFFKPRNVGSVLISSLIVGVAESIGSFLCFIPGLVVAIFTIFTTLFIVERNLTPVDGIKASIDVVKNNFVQVLLTWLIIGVITVVGALLCGVGLLVAAPVAYLFLVFAYRRLTGGQVAPLTP